MNFRCALSRKGAALAPPCPADPAPPALDDDPTEQIATRLDDVGSGDVPGGIDCPQMPDRRIVLVGHGGRVPDWLGPIQRRK